MAQAWMKVGGSGRGGLDWGQCLGVKPGGAPSLRRTTDYYLHTHVHMGCSYLVKPPGKRATTLGGETVFLLLTPSMAG